MKEKSLSKTPSPIKDRIFGSKVNKEGSAASSKSAFNIEFVESTIKTLENKRDEYNAKHPNNKVTLATLKAVFRRGAGAYSTSHRPNITRSGWAYARVNKFLLKKGGTKVKAAYVQDDDLMENGAILDSSCKTYISQNESVLKTGYYLNLSEFSSMIDPYGQIPLNLTHTLVTYNSGNQDGLSLIDTINPINLQNALADILNIPINKAQIVVGLYIEMGKKLKSISQIEGNNIIIIDRDMLVCKSEKNDALMEQGGLLAPNLKPSNLTPEQYKLVRTPKFKAWFGDWENDPENASKVVDENGEPLVVYHFTDSKFDIFNIDKSKRNLLGKGFYFTNNKNIEGVAKKIGRNIEIYRKDVFLNIVYPRLYLAMFKDIENPYDGVIYDTTYVVDNPKKIKLADGSNTTFDAENPDIRYEQGGELGQDIICMECGWEWNTNDSDEFDKYVCHNCGLDNTKYYKPIENMHLGGNIKKHLAPNGKRSNLTHEQWHLVRTPEFKAWFGDWERLALLKLKDSGIDEETLNNIAKDVSKVVDENGEPLVVYHGSRYGGITIFDINESKREGSGLKEYGSFFITNLNIAEVYRSGGKYTKEVNEERIREISKLEKLLGTVKSNREYEQIEKEIDKWYSKTYEVFLNLKNVKVFDANFGTNKSGYYNLEVDAGYKIANGNDAISFLKDGRFGVEKVDGIIANNIIELLQKPSDWKDYVGTSFLVFNETPQYIKLADGTNSTFDINNPDIRYEQGGLLAPNGNVSKLTPEQYKLVRTPEFKAWFGDWEKHPKKASKILDENGEPLVCFHGTNEDFTIFNDKYVGMSNDMGFYGKGFYFTFQTKTDSLYYAFNEAAYYGKKILTCFIKAINPFDFSVLSKYKGHDINYYGVETIVFLSNLVKYFPSLADKIMVDKQVYNSNKNVYNFSQVSINIIPQLIEKYSKELTTFVTNNDFGERNIKSGYVKKEIVEYDDTSKGGKKGSYESIDQLGRIEFRVKDGIQYPSDAEIEILLICDAIRKYDGIEPKYQPEGFMTRNNEITEAIKKHHDCILQNKSGDELCVFYPNQIKLADGSNTTFDANNPDIRYEEGGNIDEEAQMYIDVISMNPNLEKYAKYKEVLKTKFGIDYDEQYGNNDEKLIDNANLNNLKSKNDFLNYDNYVKYAYKLFRLRGFIKNQPNKIEGIVGIDLAKKIGSALGFEVKFKEYDGHGNYASAMGNLIILPNDVDINTFIHEIGHYFDYYYCKDYVGNAKNSIYATSLYEVGKADEVFAENFMTYFIAPDWLKNNMPIVYYELDEKIPKKFKEVINNLIIEVNKNNNAEMQSKPYHLGGEMSLHLAPNGKPSNLTHEQWHLVRTPEFKAWFGDWETEYKSTAISIKNNRLIYNGKDIGVFQITNKNRIIEIDKLSINKEYQRSGIGRACIQYIFNNYNNDIIELYPLSDAFWLRSGVFNVREDGYFEIDRKKYICSKVVDENGEPLVCYHGTNKDFWNFSEDFKGSNTPDENTKFGFFFSKYKDEAKVYMREAIWKDTPEKYDELYGARIIEVFLSIKNPLKVGYAVSLNVKKIINLLSKKNDGIFDERGDYIAFEPTQIKLADGSNITFDANNPDIRYEQGGEIPQEIESFFKEYQKINIKVNQAHLKLNDIANQNERFMGLVSDDIKKSKEFIEAKNEFNYAFKELQGFNLSQSGKAIQKYLKGLDRMQQMKIRKMYYYNGGTIDESLKEGGMLKKPHSIEEIARKHKVSVDNIIDALKQGIEVEREHTNDFTIAKTISLHHLYESPTYYDKLKIMESNNN